MAKSLFLEGIDGTGKSTLAKLLQEHLESLGESVVVLREPGGSDYYQAIRDHIHFSDLQRSALSDALTCAGGIAENIRITKEALSNNTWVITDRCYISNAVYQVAQGLSSDVVDEINTIARAGFEYDKGVVLDIPLSVAEERLLHIGKKHDRWESMGDEYFEMLRSLYLTIADKNSIPVVSAKQSIQQVLKEVIEILNS